ncbi:putative hydrolase of the HAD superfamily [Frondihabitans sp. PhB188]|uniref:HAD family hydrolase n=1 Tax=Frondihabitans sp. PhB188 TaxID=2485200 RepID=UPI000F4AE886|nr:HAD family hydrolase [Frondihabitans sp. PhB188]ROQ39801.1 putative hydrolase of the HAD superfamily [Frondihabitans sp. PhB188]
MGYSAVLFDLYGTLAPGGTRATRDAVSLQVADDLGVDPTAFCDLVRDTFLDRTLGRLGSLEETLRTLAGRLGGSPDDAAVERAVGRRLGMTASLLEQTWALEVLDELRDRGYALALVSDCSVETAVVWPTTALAERFQTAAFSSVHGVKKPDARLYRAATDVLGVEPEECVYVGDGGSTELPGAAALGMRAIWLDHPGNDGGAADPGWSGEAIHELRELLGLLRPLHVPAPGD